MDGNKDEALKCLQIAKASIQSGDRTRALKFITKARKLDPTLATDHLLSSLNDSSPPETNNQPTNEFDPLSSGPRRRVPTANSSSSATYTQEQVTMVKEIKKKKDYYDILGVEKTCGSDDIRKAYRKLSLKVHPDKNNAPGAEEAFKMVSKAFQCLSDEENRKKYDVTGSEEVVYARRGGNNGNGMRGFNGFYDGDVDADEIFRNFFFGGMNPATTGNFNGFSFGTGGVRVRTGGVGVGVDQGNNWIRTLIQLLPIILIILVNFLPTSDPMYSLSRQYSYNHRFVTQKGVNFFVKSASFDREFPPNSQERVEIERQVEGDYRSVLAQNCRQEYQQAQWGYRREMPNCDAMKRFDGVAQ